MGVLDVTPTTLKFRGSFTMEIIDQEGSNPLLRGSVISKTSWYARGGRQRTDSSDLRGDPGTGMRELLGLGVPEWKGKEKKRKREAVKKKRLTVSLSRLVDLDILLTVGSKGEGEWTLGVKTLVAHGVG